MLASLLTPKTQDRIKFSFANLNEFPENAGCYAITNYNGVILYIGQAKNIYNRMEQHLDDFQKRQQTPSGKAFWFYYLFCPIIELDDLERGWLNEHLIKEGVLPFFNKQRGNV